MRLLCVCLIAVAVGCDGHTVIKGRVIDPEGKGVPDATVVLAVRSETKSEREATTDKDGDFSVGGTHAPMKLTWELRINKAGYKPYSEIVEWQTREHVREIVLQLDDNKP